MTETRTLTTTVVFEDRGPKASTCSRCGTDPKTFGRAEMPVCGGCRTDLAA